MAARRTITYETLFGEQRTVLVRGKHYVKPNGYAAPPGSGPKEKTCKDCGHYCRVASNYLGRRRFPKCGLNRANWTGGRGSDILAGAPACLHFKEPE
jgi:hypothetical protein